MTAASIVLLVALATTVTGCSTPTGEATATALEQTSAAPSTASSPTGDSGTSGPPDGPMIDMARIDGPAVQGYANKHGVTPEQAQQIINWQAEVNQ